MITNDAIHLQVVGLHPAKPVSALVVGDITVWNGGNTARVVAITEASKHFLYVDTVYRKDGLRGEMAEHRRRMKKDRLVACQGLTYVARPWN